MKTKVCLALFTMLAWGGMAFAANYYNLMTVVKTETTGSYGFGMTPTTTTSTTLVLSQGSKPCSSTEWNLTYDGASYTSDGKGNVGYYSSNTWGWGAWPGYGWNTFTDMGDCIASVEDTPANLSKMLQEKWIDNKDMKGVHLELGSDIDLGEFSSETAVGTCDVNHVPLTMMSNTSFNGNHFTIKHLCYTATVTSKAPMKTPVGFFKTAENGTLQNVNFNGVRIYINGESSNGKDYYPVGALVGMVSLVTVDSVVLANDSIQAPFAGALVGLVENSTISSITGDDDIFVSNKVVVETGYAGSEVLGDLTDHQVFLGGVVGAAVRTQNEEDPTFINDSVKVDVHDSAKGHKSALGGIAGFFRTTGDTLENLQIFTKYKENGEIVASRISGGASMGGLIGALSVYRENSGSKTEGNFVVKNSRFDGKISRASSIGEIGVGGIIGYNAINSSINSRTSVQVIESNANIEVKDTLKVALGEGKYYQYYAGGIVGYGGSCVSGSTNDNEFLSVTGSKTTGAITVAALGSAGVHGDAYLGGIAGYACIARAKGKGFTNDTSSVAITSKVKTAVDGNRVNNGAYARDNVYVGGIAGFIDLAVSKIDTMTNLYFDGSIAVEDSLNRVFVGGILGGFLDGNNKSLHVENVVANNAKLITFNAKEAQAVSTTNAQVAAIGGICGVCNEMSGINFVGVSGEINVMGTHAGDSLMVGGLIGSTRADVMWMNLHNSFNIGNINVSESSKNRKVGYLIGNAALGKGFDIRSNYHYGAKDASVEEPFGFLKEDSYKWRTSDSIFYVIRNANESKYTDKHHNGTEYATVMQSAKFAGFLNGAYKADEYAWAYVPGINSDLPIFADSENEPVEPGVVYVVVFVDKNNKTIKRESVDEKGSATPPTEEEMAAHEIEGYEFNGNWLGNYKNVTADVTVVADYDKKSYLVRFFNHDSTVQVGDDQMVEYMDGVDRVPEAPAREGYTFIGWSDSSYNQVKRDLNIKALYTANKYLIVFKDYNDNVFGQDSLYYDSPVSAPVDVTRESKDGYEYKFKGWDPEVAAVKGDAVYTATYDSTKIKYEVTFVDEDGVLIGAVQLVDHGDAAVAPEVPERDGYTFVRWVPAKFDNIVERTKVTAIYEKIPESSSSVESSSSEEASSSSVVPESESSSAEESSSSEEIVPESSSSEPESSSSRGEIKIVAPRIDQSGNAVLLTFDSAENADTASTARVVVKGENGVIVDTVISRSVVDGGQWEMTPAPIGKFLVTLIVGNTVRTAEYEDQFEVASEIMAAPGSWQMVSLSAFDKTSFKTDDATLYWWDEQNPVGDYWQYRAFAGEKTEATRGFWYGTTDGKPLVLRESTGSKDSEIEWELDSLYSGWNLVANPYGWYVDLSKGTASNSAKVTFWRWNPTAAEYEMPKMLGPYEAVWAKVSKKTTWKMSAAPVFKIHERAATEGDKKALHKEAAGVKGAWNMKVSLTDEYGKQDSWNVIGAGTAESLDEPPAGMGDRVSLAIREVLADGKKSAKLAKSVVPVAGEYRWVLDVSANSARDGKIKFDGVAELNRQGFKLFVEADGETTELRDGQAYGVALAKSARQVEVRVVASNAVVATKMSNFGSTVADGMLTLGFTAPDNLAGANASYAVVGVDGKKVTAGSFKAAAGTNQFSLKAPKTGVYFVKVKVGSQQLSGKVLVR